MNAAQRNELKTILANRQKEVEERLRTIQGGLSRVDHAQEVLEQDGDDAPQRASDREVDQARVDMETVELSKINAALVRIDSPEYGLCVSCGATIPFERLKIEPMTQRCVPCKSKAE